MLCSPQLAAIARYWGSSRPALRAQSSLASVPQAWTSSAPVRPATEARMQPGAGGGWLFAGGGQDQHRQGDEGHDDAGDRRRCAPASSAVAGAC